jgi:hypothetical protein
MFTVTESGTYETRLLQPLCYGERQGYWQLLKDGKVVASEWWYFELIGRSPVNPPNFG